MSTGTRCFVAFVSWIVYLFYTWIVALIGLAGLEEHEDVLKDRGRNYKVIGMVNLYAFFFPYTILFCTIMFLVGKKLSLTDNLYGVFFYRRYLVWCTGTSD